MFPLMEAAKWHEGSVFRLVFGGDVMASCPEGDGSVFSFLLRGDGQEPAFLAVNDCVRRPLLCSLRWSEVVCGWPVVVLKGDGGGPCPALLLRVGSRRSLCIDCQWCSLRFCVVCLV